MSIICISDKKDRVVKINANAPFTICIDGITMPSSYEKDGKHELTCEYAWFYMGQSDRKEIENEVMTNPTQFSENDMKRIKLILDYRSPTGNQMRWIKNINKCGIDLPQVIWDLNSSTMIISHDKGDDFEYEFIQA